MNDIQDQLQSFVETIQQISTIKLSNNEAQEVLMSFIDRSLFDEDGELESSVYSEINELANRVRNKKDISYYGRLLTNNIQQKYNNVNVCFENVLVEEYDESYPSEFKIVSSNLWNIKFYWENGILPFYFIIINIPEPKFNDELITKVVNLFDKEFKRSRNKTSWSSATNLPRCYNLKDL